MLEDLSSLRQVKQYWYESLLKGLAIEWQDQIRSLVTMGINDLRNSRSSSR